MGNALPREARHDDDPETRIEGLKRIRQCGFTLMLLLLLLGVGAGAALFSFFGSAKLTLENDQKTADALARAKAALIGYALRGSDGATNPQRPGEFPCPDTNNDGFDDGTCVAGRLGRIPWKTLGIPEPKDSAGETLWYAIAGPFRVSNVNNSPINSDTRGNITVFAADGTTQLTPQAVAVIFAPGQALGAQNRDAATTALCATTSTTIAQNRCAANYLETSGSTPRNNATTNGPFIVGRLRDPGNPNYNDRVLYITTPEFMPAVEMRVAKELKTRLDGYRVNSLCKCYPWADSFASADDTSNDGVNRGRFPLTALPENWSPPVPPPPPGSIPALPSWFGTNKWHNVIYYSVARLAAEIQLPIPPGFCTPLAACTLSVDGTPGVAALFFTPGTPPTGINRPSNNLADYLRDAQNYDGANDLYVTPNPNPRTLDRNRITIITSTICAQNAAALLALVPCGQPPRLNPQCTALVADLAMCSCLSAGYQLITPPCENVLNPPACQSAVATLKACNS